MLTDPAHDAPPAALTPHAFSSLFQAVNGLRNRRAIVALLVCTVAGVLVASLVLTMSGALGMLAGLLAMLVWIVAIGTGVNAAGLLQMDSARGISQRSIVDALVHGLMCIPKLLVLGLAFFAVEIVVFIAIALLLLICKIPFLGPLLFVVVFPLSVVAVGITIVGVALCVVLSLPAIWQGASITRALAQTLTIVKSRLVEAVLLLVFVGLLSALVGFVLFGVLAAGLVPTLGLSASIVGFTGFGGFNGMGALMGATQGFGGSGHVLAGAVGGALLWAVAGSLVGQVYLRGLSLVYLRVTEGLDLSATEAVLLAALDEARRRTSELGDKARAAAGQGAATASGAGAGAAAGTAIAASATAAAEPVTEPYAASFPSPVYKPPPAYFAPPMAAAPAASDAPDIELPFGEATAPRPAPSLAAPPAWAPPPAQLHPPPAPAAAPVPTTCPQCLSPVARGDAFCGVCGYRVK